MRTAQECSLSARVPIRVLRTLNPRHNLGQAIIKRRPFRLRFASEPIGESNFGAVV